MHLSPGHELVIGLAAPIGSDNREILKQIQQALDGVTYAAKIVRLSGLLKNVTGIKWGKLQGGPEDLRYNTHMDAGNALRQKLGGDAMAMLAVTAIREHRRAEPNGRNELPVNRCAYLIGSLKHPDEVKTLRRIYGPAFFLIGAYKPRESRLNYLARRIAETHHEFQHLASLPKAEDLLVRDESEHGNRFGQNVRDVFQHADYFIDATSPKSLRGSAERMIKLIFGYEFETPNKDEFMMFHARAAALRSASLQRQVGAVIATSSGDIIAVGTNEVPKAGGGLYWPGDDPDHRDFCQGYEISDRLKRRMLADVFDKLKKKGWLNSQIKKLDVEELVSRAIDSGESSFLKGSQVMSIIEFGRCVHAEMAAIVDAARRGATVAGATLYSSTFPCHECARHIVAAGIARVVYIEPYPKSLVPELYPDSISVDQVNPANGQVPFQPFVGVAPRRYMDVFEMRIRRNQDGSCRTWDPSIAEPRLGPYPAPPPVGYITQETGEIKRFDAKMTTAGVGLIGPVKDRQRTRARSNAKGNRA